MGSSVDKIWTAPYDRYQVAQGDQRIAPAGAKKGTEMDHIKDAPINEIAEAMRKGGGFMSSLADALMRSDETNAQRILDAWHDEILDLWVTFGERKKYHVDMTVEIEAKDMDDAWERAFVDGEVVYVDEPVEVNE